MVERAVHRFFEENRLLPCSVVVAASGGADSTALLLALVATPGVSLSVAHVNHHLRGDESACDQEFVRELASKACTPFHCADGTLDPARVRAVGVEAAAREIRYQRLAEIRAATGARWIATGHQRNDQAETVAMRLLASGSLDGFSAIQPMRADGVIRPLLEVTRQQIDDYLTEKSVRPRADSSNVDRRFSRNRIRARLVGAEIDGLAALAARAHRRWQELARRVAEVESSTAVIEPQQTTFTSWPPAHRSEDPLAPDIARSLLRRHIRRLDPAARPSGRSVDRLAHLPAGETRVSVTRELELLRRGGSLILRRRPTPVAPFQAQALGASRVALPEAGLTVVLRRLTAVNPADAARHRETLLIQLPPAAVEEFVIRNRRPGDRWQPLGLQGTKKLKDFLIDRKIASELRDRLPLVIWNDEIACVAGVEIGERFKLTDGPGPVFEVSLEDWRGISDGQTGLQRR